MKQRAQQVGRAALQRAGWLRHLVRAVKLFLDSNAGHLAAGVSYYAFFAAFALLLLAFSLLGMFLGDNSEVTRTTERFLSQNVPQLDVGAVREASGAAGIVGLIGLLFTGLAWVDALRAAMRAIWHVERQPGNVVLRRGVDLLVLVGLGLLLAASVAVAVGVNAAIQWLVLDAANVEFGPVVWLVSAAGFLLGVAVNAVLAAAMLIGLPRVTMPFRRVVVPALLVAVGLEILKTVGRLYIARTESNPAYQVVATAVGLLLFLYLFNQLLLFATALTATARAEPVVDRGTGEHPKITDA